MADCIQLRAVIHYVFATYRDNMERQLTSGGVDSARLDNTGLNTGLRKRDSTQLNRKTRTQVSDISISVSILSKQIIETILLYNFLGSVSDTSQVGAKIKLNCLVRPELI